MATRKTTTRKAASRKPATKKTETQKTKGEKGTKRTAKGTFARGHKGGPGRKRGVPNLITLALRDQCDRRLPEILTTLADQAAAGDVRAATFLLERRLPPAKDEAANIELPQITTPSDAVAAHARITAALNGGEITATQAAALATSVNAAVKAIEVTSLAERLTAIEQRLAASAGALQS